MILACIALNPVARASPGNKHREMMTKIKIVISYMKETLQELKNTPSTKQICVYKICSRPIPRPVIADDIGHVKVTGKWWKERFKSELEASKPRKYYKIADILLNKNRNI